MPDQPTMTAREAAERFVDGEDDIHKCLNDPFEAGGYVTSYVLTVGDSDESLAAANVLERHHAARLTLYREAVELMKGTPGSPGWWGRRDAVLKELAKIDAGEAQP